MFKRYVGVVLAGVLAVPMAHASYVGGNPLTYTDPTGKVAYVNVSGNNVTIVLPIVFKGGNWDQQQAMARMPGTDSLANTTCKRPWWMAPR
jgi:hypothetical protein